MRRWMAGLLMLLPSAVQAADHTRELMDALFGHMATAYVCRDALGGLAHYQAAISIATGSLPLVGVPQDEAVLMVDKMAAKFEADTRIIEVTPANTQGCAEAMNDGLRKIEVAKAKISASN